MRHPAILTRRRLLQTTSAATALVAAQSLLPAWARNVVGTPEAGPRTGPHEFDLTIAKTPISIDGREGSAVTLNGGIPGPVMRFKEGETVTIRVHNRLDEDTSIHWHGILLPSRWTGYRGFRFRAIGAGTTFTYEYPVKQSGTYWYHRHSGLQEQLGHYGPLIIDPLKPDPVAFDREHIIVLSDWMFENPYRVFAKLKKESDYLNFQKRTVGTFFDDIADAGLGATLRDRLAWGEMKTDPADIADITGHIYTYLMNGQGPGDGWTGLFKPGERVRLRFINASTMSYFNVRIPGLPLTVIEADGQPVRPVSVDEFQIAVAETFDFLVTPKADQAYTIFAESLDDDKTDSAELQALYSRTILSYWNAHVGVRSTFEPTQAWDAVIGMEGLAPLFFKINAAAFISAEAVQGRVEASYQLLLTQRLIAEPLVEVNLSSADIADREVKAGFSSLEAGVRLRYEIIREVALYVGFEYVRNEAAEDDKDSLRFVAGVRLWY